MLVIPAIYIVMRDDGRSSEGMDAQPSQSVMAAAEWGKWMAYHFSKTLQTSFDDAVTRTKAALAERGFGVLSEIDVAATLKAKLNVDMPAYRILGACNPGYAYRALQAEPLIGTMLPCNVIVRSVEDGAVEVAAVDPVASMKAIENEALATTANEVQRLLREAVQSL